MLGYQLSAHHLATFVTVYRKLKVAKWHTDDYCDNCSYCTLNLAKPSTMWLLHVLHMYNYPWIISRPLSSTRDNLSFYCYVVILWPKGIIVHVKRCDFIRYFLCNFILHLHGPQIPIIWLAISECKPCNSSCDCLNRIFYIFWVYCRPQQRAGDLALSLPPLMGKCPLYKWIV